MLLFFLDKTLFETSWDGSRRFTLWCFMSSNQYLETRVSVNVILWLIEPSRCCPFTVVQFLLERFQGSTPKVVLPQPTSPPDPGAVICRWAPLPQITAFESSPSTDERGTLLKGSCRRKCHSCRLACTPPPPQTELKKMWWQSDSKHFMLSRFPALTCPLELCEDEDVVFSN